MSIELRFPNITGNEREQLVQIRSYLYQLVPQLQWALNNIGTQEGVNGVARPSSVYVTPPAVARMVGMDAEAKFEEIKALIIKSADIVDAYYEEINKRLEGVYVAQSDFGNYAQQTAQELEANSTSTTQRFENLQIIITGHDSNLASIEESLQTFGEDISYTQNDIVTIKGNVEGIASEVVNLESNIGELDTNLKETTETLSKNITDTEGKLTATITETKTLIEGSIDTAVTEAKGYTDTAKEELSSSLVGAKNELSGSIDNAKTELSGSIDNAKSELTGMVNEVDEDLQGTKTEVNERIDDTNGNVAGLGEGLNDANSRLAEVDQDLQDSKTAINNSIQGVQDRVTGVNALLEDAKAQLKGSIDDLEVYVAGMKQAIIGVSAYLKSGLLYTTDAGIPVYGLEIGQSVRDEVAGTEVFNKYARFTSEKLSFYDSNAIEVAYISDKKLYIKMAEITVSFKIGGLISLVMPSGDVVEKWVGG